MPPASSVGNAGNRPCLQGLRTVWRTVLKGVAGVSRSPTREREGGSEGEDERGIGAQGVS